MEGTTNNVCVCGDECCDEMEVFIVCGVAVFVISLAMCDLIGSSRRRGILNGHDCVLWRYGV